MNGFRSILDGIMSIFRSIGSIFPPETVEYTKRHYSGFEQDYYNIKSDFDKVVQDHNNSNNTQ